MNAIS